VAELGRADAWGLVVQPATTSGEQGKASPYRKPGNALPPGR